MYPQNKVTLMYILLLSLRTSPYLISLHFFFKKKSLHTNRHFTPHHYTSHHLIDLHSTPTWIPLLVTTFLTVFLKVFILQAKDARKPAGNWFQFLMVLFTKKYFPVIPTSWRLSVNPSHCSSFSLRYSFHHTFPIHSFTMPNASYSLCSYILTISVSLMSKSISSLVLIPIAIPILIFVGPCVLDRIIITNKN